MSITLYFLAALSTQGPLLQPSPAEMAAIAAAARAANAGRQITLPGERYADLEIAQMELIARQARDVTSLIEATPVCEALLKSQDPTIDPSTIIDAWAADSYGSDASGSETATITARSEALKASAAQAQSAIQLALDQFCSFTRP